MKLFVGSFIGLVLCVRVGAESLHGTWEGPIGEDSAQMTIRLTFGPDNTFGIEGELNPLAELNPLQEAGAAPGLDAGCSPRGTGGN